MFKQTLKNLDKLNYILIIQNGAYNVIDRYTRKMHLSFSNTTPEKNKEKILSDFYDEVSLEKDEVSLEKLEG